MLENQAFSETFGLVPRDQADLLDLPLKFRWEFTRRHPYYLSLWRLARDYRVGALPSGSEDANSGMLALCILGMIGVTGEPADPAYDFSELGEADPGFLPGCVQPMTVRNMLVLLLSQLPRAELDCLRACIDLAVAPECAIEGDTELALQKRNAINHFLRLNSAAYDSYFEAPLYYIHLESSNRRILEDVKLLVRREKERRGISERRTRTNEFLHYLKVWDLREGWKNGAYDLKMRMTFIDIAEKLRKPKSSVVAAYRAAFQRITGHDFKNELWVRVMAPMLFHEDNRTFTQTLLRRYSKMMDATIKAAVPESRVQSKPTARGSVGLVERESAVESDMDLVDMVLDLRDLIGQGDSNEQIAEKLELKSLELVVAIRGQLEELDR